MPALGEAKLQQGLDMKLNRLFSSFNGEDSKEKMERLYGYYNIPTRTVGEPAKEDQGGGNGGFLGEMSWD